LTKELPFEDDDRQALFRSIAKGQYDLNQKNLSDDAKDLVCLLLTLSFTLLFTFSFSFFFLAIFVSYFLSFFILIVRYRDCW
jgi:hypothetical protein